MDSKLLTRIKELEKRAGYTDVIGIREAGSKIVKVGDSEVIPTVDEFFKKYPKATLIVIEYADSPADIVVRWVDDEIA
jgi:hypothetical protein